MTKWKTLTSEKDYDAAIKRIDALLDIKRTDSEENELDLLSFLIEEYEAEHYPMPDASPLEVLKFIMEMKDIKQKDLIPILGTKGNVSKILSGKANIQLDDIQPLSAFLGIPAESLIPKGHTYTKSYSTFAGYAEEPESAGREIVREVRKPRRGKSYRSQSRRSKPVAKKSRRKSKT